MRKRLAPVELELVRIAVFVKLLKGLGEGCDSFFYGSGVRVNQLPFRRITLFGRKLMYLYQYVFTVAYKPKIEFLRVAVPFQ